tara:strand:+ start:2872 stop:3450 length:579 start_codon:yes stop_codon:yes gene_type:complete
VKIIGLTGGIGSGKSKILKEFQSFGVPCYESDKVAKNLIKENKNLIEKIKIAFGVEVFNGKKIDNKKLASIVFKDKSKLDTLNSIVHPEVSRDFSSFISIQKSNYIIKEAAILMESGEYKNCDLIILVIAPKNDRVKRVIKRDGVASRNVFERMRNQWEDSKKIPLADFIIENKDWNKTIKKIREIHQILSS